MPSNIEIKARVRDPARQLALAEALADGPVETIPQEDVFFTVASGRLKLSRLLKNPSRRHARLVGSISSLQILAVATATPADLRLDLEPTRRTWLGPGFFNSLLGSSRRNTGS